MNEYIVSAIYVIFLEYRSIYEREALFNMWKNKNVWILLTGEFIAGLGLWLGIIGNLEFMQEKVPSDFVKSIILASGLLAGIAASPLAGKITDQFHKKTVMLGAGFVRASSVIFMLIAIQTGSVWWMVVFLIIF